MPPISRGSSKGSRSPNWPSQTRHHRMQQLKCTTVFALSAALMLTGCTRPNVSGIYVHESSGTHESKPNDFIWSLKWSFDFRSDGKCTSHKEFTFNSDDDYLRTSTVSVSEGRGTWKYRGGKLRVQTEEVVKEVQKMPSADSPSLRYRESQKSKTREDVFEFEPNGDLVREANDGGPQSVYTSSLRFVKHL